MAHAQHRVTIRHGIHQHADGDQIVNLIEELILNHHLAVDAVQMLGTARHFKMHAQILELLGQFLNDDFDIFLALGALHAHLARHILIALGIDIAQRQILQLGLDGVYAQAVCQRRVNIQRFAGDGHLALDRLKLERAHIVQPVGQLDQHHADIAAHGQDHLAQRFGLALLAVGKIQLAQLGHAVHQHGHLLAKLLTDHIQRHVLAVLHRIVQKARGDGGRVDADFSQDAGHIDGMDDVGLAAQAALPAVHALGKGIGALHQGGVGVGMIMLHPRDHLFQRHAFIGGCHGFNFLRSGSGDTRGLPSGWLCAWAAAAARAAA